MVGTHIQNQRGQAGERNFGSEGNGRKENGMDYNESRLVKESKDTCRSKGNFVERSRTERNGKRGGRVHLKSYNYSYELYCKERVLPYCLADRRAMIKKNDYKNNILRNHFDCFNLQ